MQNKQPSSNGKNNEEIDRQNHRLALHVKSDLLVSCLQLILHIQLVLKRQRRNHLRFFQLIQQTLFLTFKRVDALLEPRNRVVLFRLLIFSLKLVPSAF